MARRKDSGTAVIYFNTADEAMKRITPEQQEAKLSKQSTDTKRRGETVHDVLNTGDGNAIAQRFVSSRV